MLEKFLPINVSIGTEAFQLFALKDAYSEFAQHLDHGDGFEEPPLYGILWPSAEGLAETLWQHHRAELASVRVLELGCGLGLPSLLCARLGADVTAMDNHVNFGRILARNLQTNKLACQAVVGSFSDETLRLGAFHWIIASDILYEPELYPAIERFIIAHSEIGTRVVIADPGRYAASKFGATLKLKTQYQQSQQKTASGQVIDLYSFRFP